MSDDINSGGLIGAVGSKINSVRSFFQNIIDRVGTVGSKVFAFLDPVADPILRAIIWLSKKIGRLLWRFILFIFTVVDEEGRRGFDWWSTGKKLVACGILAVLLPSICMAAYYYGTVRVYRDVYIPNDGVHITEQFSHPNSGGEPISPRDEIVTVFGKQIAEQGDGTKVIDYHRFDIDTNWWFWWDNAATRPDLAASEMDSQSPYGMKCDLEVTGIYALTPRYLRILAIKYANLRGEIVKVDHCAEVLSLPKEFANASSGG